MDKKLSPTSSDENLSLRIAHQFLNLIFWIPSWIFIILFVIIVLATTNRYLFNVTRIEPYIAPAWLLIFAIRMTMDYGWRKVLVGSILFVGGVALIRWYWGS